MTASRIGIAALLFLALALATPVEAQWTQVWVNQGGAVGEPAEIVFENRLVPIPLNPAPNQPFVIGFGTTWPPLNILTTGLLDTLSQGRAFVRIPNQPGLLGLKVYLQGATYNPPPNPGWITSPRCTWLLASATHGRFVKAGPPLSLWMFGGVGRALLKNGQLLSCGGAATGGPPISAASLYDPRTDTVTTLPPLGVTRIDPTVAALANGDALVVGGESWFPTRTPTAELFDSRANAFVSLGTLPYSFSQPLATPVKHPTSGREFVLVTGSITSGTTAVGRALLYDTVSRTFTTLTNMIRPRAGAAAVAVAAGGVLITGGTDGNTVHGDAELFLLGTRSFFPWGQLARPRYDHVAVALDATHALLLGGHDGSNYLDSVEIFAGTVMAGFPLPVKLQLQRSRFTVTRLSAGGFLIVGGQGPDNPARQPEVLTAAGSIPARPVPSPAPYLEAESLGTDEVLLFAPLNHFRYKK